MAETLDLQSFTNNKRDMCKEMKKITSNSEVLKEITSLVALLTAISINVFRLKLQLSDKNEW